MTTLPFYWVDAFTQRPFAGNPAAVCPLDPATGTASLETPILQTMARQHGLSETAFVTPLADSAVADFHLRWFTPELEIDLCGHATLATAHVLFNEPLSLPTPAFAAARDKSQLRFQTLSGILTVQRDPATVRLALDFPARPPQPIDPTAEPTAVLAALGLPAATPITRARDWFVVLPDVAALRAMQPDFRALADASPHKVIVTAPGDDVDFVSRFFAPTAGVDEDPVTGSAHCSLTPYWSKQLGKSELTARQLSPRGGELWCTDRGERVEISGHAVTYLRGTIDLP